MDACLLLFFRYQFHLSEDSTVELKMKHDPNKAEFRKREAPLWLLRLPELTSAFVSTTSVSETVKVQEAITRGLKLEPGVGWQHSWYRV